MNNSGSRSYSPGATTRKWGYRIIYGLFLFLCVEVGAQLAYRIYKGSWYFRDRNTSARGLAQPHPYFAATLTPNVTAQRNGITITHNSFRMRGPDFTRPKPAGVIRVIASGGSTTYCVSVSDNETWEYYLQRELGKPWEVINNGAPGGTSVETLLQTCLLFSEVQPDIAIYYMGWNDTRVQHVKNLWPDYSDFHGPYTMSFGIGGRELEEHLAVGYLMKRAAFHYFFPRMDTDVIIQKTQGDDSKLTDKLDMRALALYERNMRLIATVCKAQGIKPVFIPQVMNWSALTSDTPYGFLPFIRDKDLHSYIDAYNATLEKVAKEEGIAFMGEMLKEKFPASEFIDQGHLTPAGNEHFARVVLTWLKQHSVTSAQ